MKDDQIHKDLLILPHQAFVTDENGNIVTDVVIHGIKGHHNSTGRTITVSEATQLVKEGKL